MPENSKVYVRPATLEDAGAIQEIYRYYVEDTAITYEYDVPDVEEMRKRMVHTMEKFPYYVAEEDGRVLGYCYASPYHERAAYQWNAELSIYLHKDEKGRGLGRLLYETIEERLKELGYLNLYACIAHAPVEDKYLKNDSEAFHERMGFKHISRSHECGYKFEKWYDMVWMEKIIGAHEVPPRPIKSNRQN